MGEQHLLGGELDRAIEREDKVVAVDRRLSDRLRAGNCALLRVDFARHRAARSGEDILVLLFEPGDALAVDVGSTEHAPTGVATRHLSARLVVDVDTGVTQVANKLSDIGVDLPSDIDEPAVFASNFVEEVTALLVGEFEQVVEVVDDHGSIDDELRVDRD